MSKKKAGKRRRGDWKRAHHDLAKIVMAELVDVHDIDTARAVAAELNLPGDAGVSMISVPFEDGKTRFFSVMKVCQDLPDCVSAGRDGKVEVFVHGTDCSMSRSIEADVRSGEKSPFVFCERRLSGGSFRYLDFDEMVKT